MLTSEYQQSRKSVKLLRSFIPVIHISNAVLLSALYMRIIIHGSNATALSVYTNMYETWLLRISRDSLTVLSLWEHITVSASLVRDHVYLCICNNIDIDMYVYDTHLFNFSLEKINPCSPNPCQNVGICTRVIGSFSCHCKPGYTGFLCECEYAN